MICAARFSQAQSVVRDVTATAADTYTAGGISMTITVGEPYGELLVNQGANLFLTTGFAQADIDVNLLSAAMPETLILYPNPASGGTVKLSFNHVPFGVYTVLLIDASGKTLQSQEVNYTFGAFTYLAIDVSRLSGGIYFIRIYNTVNFRGQVKLIKI